MERDTEERTEKNVERDTEERIRENFDYIYQKFRLALYRHIFAILGEREGSLTATDFFSVETIYLMGSPTITEFARALAISQPNATYRVKSLIDKGYVKKTETDKKSAFRLTVTDRFMKYYHENLDYGQFMFDRFFREMEEEELARTERIISGFADNLRTEGEE